MATWKPLWKAVAPTILFYLLYAASVTFLERLVRSDMCNPGAGMILLFLLPLFSVTLLLKNVFQVFVYNQPQQPVAFLHFIVCIGIWVAFYSH